MSWNNEKNGLSANSKTDVDKLDVSIRSEIVFVRIGLRKQLFEISAGWSM